LRPATGRNCGLRLESRTQMNSSIDPARRNDAYRAEPNHVQLGDGKASGGPAGLHCGGRKRYKQDARQDRGYITHQLRSAATEGVEAASTKASAGGRSHNGGAAGRTRPRVDNARDGKKRPHAKADRSGRAGTIHAGTAGRQPGGGSSTRWGCFWCAFSATGACFWIHSSAPWCAPRPNSCGSSWTAGSRIPAALSGP
jgi:hypothetical protein